MIKKILLIPRAVEINENKRLLEVGRLLSKKYDVYMLHWNKPGGNSFIAQAGACFRDIFKTRQVFESNGVLFAQYPFFHRPFSAVNIYNTSSLQKFIDDFKINVVINAVNPLFPTPFSKKYKHIFDLNDLPARENQSPEGRFTYEFARREAQKADAIIAGSQGLVDYAKAAFNRKAYLITNGVRLSDFRLDFEEIKRIRMAFNLLNKFVIGFSGYLGEWVDTDFLIDLFLELRKKSNSIAFMIIGEGPRLSNLKRQIKDNNFIFIGSLPGPKVAHYLFALNIGILPFKKTPVQDLTFHAKLVEYTVAKKMVVAAPLAEVARLNFPNIVTAGLSVDEWVKAIEQTRSMRWDSGWDGLTAGYDWTKISEKFGEVIEAK